MTESARTPGNSRAIDLLGHYASEILIGAVIAVVALPVLPLSGLLLLTVPAALLAVVILTWVLMRRHDRRLCEQCMLSMPLNLAEQASRYKRRFWVTHTGSNPRFMIPYLIVLIGSNFAASTIGRLCWAVTQLSMVYLILCYSTHRKLQPWCPWCSGGGGGEHVEDPPPVLPNDDRQLI